MADNGENKKSNILGELFVEFGVKGFGTMLKSLNAVSASFLLGKNAASQFAQMLTKPIKEAGAGAVEIGKLSNSLDTSYKNVAKLQNYLKSKNVSEGLVNDLGNIQTTVRDVLSGFTELPGSFANAFAKTGHTLSDYSEDFNDILRLVKDIQNADLSRSERNQIFDFLGMSRDWGYLFDRGDFNLNDALALPDDVIEKNIKAQENIQEFSIALKSLSDFLIAEFLPPLTDFVKWFTRVVKDITSGKPLKDIVKDLDKGVTDNSGKIAAGALVTGHPVVAAGIAAAGTQAKLQYSAGGGKGKIAVPETIPVPGSLKAISLYLCNPVKKIISQISLEKNHIPYPDFLRLAGFHHHLVSAVTEKRPHTHSRYSKNCLPSLGKQFTYC